jgi:prenylcysteine alpha-carboxyl methylesterase
VRTSRYLLSVFYSKTFVEAFQRAGAQAKLVLYEGKTHTDLFLQASDATHILLYGDFW